MLPIRTSNETIIIPKSQYSGILISGPSKGNENCFDWEEGNDFCYEEAQKSDVKPW